MFTDLVGSTALSTKLDPEDLRSVIGAYHRCVSETTARFDGFVAKYIGDGVLIYFGYPHAHEDDALKAKISKHGWFSQEAIAARKEQRAVLRALKAAAKKLALVPDPGSRPHKVPARPATPTSATPAARAALSSPFENWTYRARSQCTAGRQSRQMQEKARGYSSFGLKSQTPAPKSAQLSLARARQETSSGYGSGILKDHQDWTLPCQRLEL
jgi:hypothetical protein